MFLYNDKRLALNTDEDKQAFRQAVQRAARNKQETFSFQGNSLHTDFGQYLLNFLPRR